VDTIVRIVTERMRASLGQPIIIENVAGAAGSIGVGRVARAAPDGYTLVAGSWGTHVTNGAIYALPYDLLKDFAPVAPLSAEPNLIIARKTIPGNDLKGFVAWMKANPDKASSGTQGVGSVGHIVGAFFQTVTGTRFQHVPYRGAGPVVQDLMAEQIDISFDGPANALPQVRVGNIKALAVTAKTRLDVAPNIPTVDEAGVPAFYASNWRALWAPAGAPKDVITKINDAVVTAFAEPTVRARFNDLGQELFPHEQQTPEALGTFHKAEIEKWWPIIKAANIKGE
jgi:tripartite-type tricarboxylate transporter receptor subunit TctC